MSNSQNKSQSTFAARRLAAALLKADKKIVRHEKSTSNVSTYVSLTLVKGTKQNGLEGYVRVIDPTSKGIFNGTWEHVSTQFSGAVLVKVNWLTYGLGELPHAFFAGRNKYAEDSVEFFVAMPTLDVKDAIVLAAGKEKGTFIRSDILTDIFGGKANSMLESVVRHIVAVQNMLANGGMDSYDVRETVRGNRVTPYGQYVLDNGKRQDKALQEFLHGGKAVEKNAAGEIELPIS